MQGMKRHYLQLLYELLSFFHGVAIVGVRHCGKTILQKEQLSFNDFNHAHRPFDKAGLIDYTFI